MIRIEANSSQPDTGKHPDNKTLLYRPISRRRMLSDIAVGTLARILAPIATATSPFWVSAKKAESSQAAEDAKGFTDQFSQETNFWIRNNLSIGGQNVNFLSEFVRLGGVDFAGYPISRPFIKDGFVYQAFQRQILQWRPEINQVYPANTMDLLHDKNKDDWLAEKGIPKPIIDDGSGGDLEKAKQIRARWMTNPQIRTKYLSAADPITYHGLPASMPEKHGPYIIQRFQRGGLQLWVDKTDGMPFPGTVVGILAGEYVRDAGIFIPQEALVKETPDSKTQPSIVPDAPKVEQVKSPETFGEFKNRVGWAYSPLPETSSDQMMADMRKIKAGGANIVYIGHINPDEVEGMPPEPGLGFAVYYARKTSYNETAKANAESMFQGVMRTLEAAKQNGLAVVLPIGYQIEMGEQWTRENNQHLRKNPDGSNMNHWGEKDSGPTASPYSPKYRQDISEYYQWIQDTVISKYPNVLALNLGDEPMGGDYSSWAKQTFQDRNGKNFDQADPRSQGEFESGVLADYAQWSAETWKRINPRLKTMMTFHIQRDVPFFPNFEKIFQQTPDTFIFSADTHMHDAPPNGGISNSDRNELLGMVRYLGWLSNVYNKPLMLWSAANAWGLDNPAGNNPSGGGINEARDNFRIVTDVAKQNGAIIDMVMAWGYNMGTQGLYGKNDGQRPYNPDAMFNQISSDMAAKRDSLSQQIPGRPGSVIYLPADALYRYIGENKVSHLMNQGNPLVNLNNYDFVNGNIVYLTDGPALERAKREGCRIIQVTI